jgi:hypothetical protein
MDFLSKNIRKIQAGVQDHNRTCGVPARAILLHPIEHKKLGVRELWGLAVCADERVRLGRFRIDCEGSAWRVEDELELYTQQLTTSTPRTSPGAPLEQPLAARADPQRR